MNGDDELTAKGALLLVPDYLQPLGYSQEQADQMTAEFAEKWMNEAWCSARQTWHRQLWYVAHEGPAATALEIHYLIGLSLPPNRKSFIDWRTKFYKANPTWPL